MAEDIRIGVYICHCGINIAYKVDVEAVRDFAATLDHVVIARDYKFMCSNPGQQLIIDDIKELGLNRVVVASCSPRMHEKTFRNDLKKAGINPYYFQMASIREQVSWVTEDEEEATEKAKQLVKAAVYRVAYHEPLEPRIVDINPNVLVIGGGIAGMQAALQIADAGKTVYLVEREPTVGGHMAKFDKTFPTLDCAACILTPKMVSVGQHENIKLFTYSEVKDVSGYIGNFKATIHKKARFIDEETCTGCSECVKGCPVSLPSEYEYGMTDRTAIYRSFPQAVPNVFVIDKEGFSPCRNACPASLNAHGYVKLIGAGKYKEAFNLILDRVIFPASLGRACPAFCEGECTRGLAGGPLQIRMLKRFVADWYYENEGLELPFELPEKKEKRVAVVGAGPAGLSCAFYLARKGYQVKVLEAAPEPGGMLRYGIPNYRIPNELVDKEVEFIKKTGVEIECSSPVGKDGISLNKLKEEYDAVFVGIGAHKDRKMGIEGEDLDGVWSSIEFLRRVNSGEKVDVGEKVIVVGGGNSAVDAARSALRLGAKEVTIVYRRSRVEMPAYVEEIEAAEEEGVKLRILTNPVKFLGKNGKLAAAECIKMELGEPDESGRRRPIPVEGSEFTIDADRVILAIGQEPYSEPLAAEGLKVNRNGTIWVDPETLQTNLEGVFAGGDATKGPASIVEAIGLGRQAAEYISHYLEGEDLKARPYEELWMESVDKEEVLKKRRYSVSSPVSLRHLDTKERISNFAEVEQPMSEEEALEEAKRCLDCAGCCECRECEKLCEANAIRHEMKDQEIEVYVGSIIVATGFKPIDPSAETLSQFGYGRYPEVYTSIEFERLNNAAGPTSGEVLMKNGKKPERVAIIHCVGSRDANNKRYCSRVCCMYSMKFAHLVREKVGAEVYEFYIDIRSPGKGYEEFYNRLQEEGVHFIRGKVAQVTDVPLSPEEEGKLIVVAEDTLAGKVRRVPVDMVLLSVGLEPAEGAEEIARLVGISQDQDGWFIELHPKLAPLSTASDGVFLAGCCQGPKDIPDTVSQAEGAASEALSLIMRGQVEVEAAVSHIDPEVCVGCQQCMGVCMYSAIEYNPAQGLCVVNAAICKGCGLCAATCPNKAVTTKHFNNQEIFAELEGVLL